MGILSWIILGLIAGFIASKIVNKTGSGMIMDIALGVVGAIVGGFIASGLFGMSGVTGVKREHHSFGDRRRRRAVGLSQVCSNDLSRQPSAAPPARRRGVVFASLQPILRRFRRFQRPVSRTGRTSSKEIHQHFGRSKCFAAMRRRDGGKDVARLAQCAHVGGSRLCPLATSAPPPPGRPAPSLPPPCRGNVRVRGPKVRRPRRGNSRQRQQSLQRPFYRERARRPRGLR